MKKTNRRIDFLKLMPRNGIIAEVGVHIGEFSKEIYDVCQPKELHLIDAWDLLKFDSDGYHKTSGRDKIVEEKFKEIESVFLHRQYSIDAVKEFADYYFDWVYIDANHSYESVKIDLELYSKKVKISGLLAGHDYHKGCPGVIQAVDEFVSQNPWEMVLFAAGDPHPSWALKRVITL